MSEFLHIDAFHLDKRAEIDVDTIFFLQFEVGRFVGRWSWLRNQYILYSQSFNLLNNGDV